MLEPTIFCKDCAHCIPCYVEPDGSIQQYQESEHLVQENYDIHAICRMTLVKSNVSVVTGECDHYYESCVSAREQGDCGMDAKFFVARGKSDTDE